MTIPLLPLVTLYSKPDCHLCEEAKRLLKQLQTEHPFSLQEINILEHETLATQYGEEIPVVLIDGRKAFKYRIDPEQFVRRLRRSRYEEGRRLWQRLWPR